MAISRKHGKNLARVQSMLDGDYKKKIQVGYGDTAAPTRKVGDVWEDAEGDKWEQKEGYISKIGKLPAVGLMDNCSECGKMIKKGRDRNTFNRMDKCYYCQLEFEATLKSEGKYHDWWKDQEIKRWDAVFKELEQIEKENKEVKPIDKKFLNALANENVEMAVKKSK